MAITIKNRSNGEVILTIDANTLQGADLRWANLREADLRWADLQGADLQGADLREADLQGAVGNMQEIKSAQFDAYPLTWTKDTLQIGCQSHTIEEWREFDYVTILNMDGKRALQFWRKYKAIIFTLIDASSEG